MSLTLDSNLQTQLDGIERRPIVQVVSTSFASSIPFVGNYFDISQSSAFNADLKYLSTGELVTVSVDSSVARTIRYLVTDTSRTQWSEYTFQTNDLWGTIGYVSCCEKTDGSIGIAYLWNP